MRGFWLQAVLSSGQALLRAHFLLGHAFWVFLVYSFNLTKPCRVKGRGDLRSKQCGEGPLAKSSQGVGPSPVEAGHTSVRTQFAQCPSHQPSGLCTLCRPCVHTSPAAIDTHLPWPCHTPLHAKQKVGIHHRLPDVLTQESGMRKGLSLSIHVMVTLSHLDI